MSPLRCRMIEDMQIRNLTTNTQRVYVAHLVRFACYFRKSPDLLGPAEIRTYLIHLTQERRLAASSIIVTVSALRFFYTVTLKRTWVVEDDIPAGRQSAGHAECHDAQHAGPCARLRLGYGLRGTGSGGCVPPLRPDFP
jgi:integrase/recombinase XerD